MCIQQRTPCCVTSRRKSNGRWWRSTKGGGTVCGPCSASERRACGLLFCPARMIRKRMTCLTEQVRSRTRQGLFGGPGSQQSPQVNQLRDMVGVVIGDQQDLPQNRLAVAPRNFRE